MFLNPDRYFAHKKDWFILSVFAGLFLLLKIIAIGLVVLASKLTDISDIMPLIDTDGQWDEGKLFYALVFAPLFETLVFQFLIIKGLFYIQPLKKYPAVAILISAIVFSLVHNNPFTVIFAGVVLAYNFYFFNKHRSASFAYWSTVLLHCFYNLVTYLIAHKYIDVWL